MQQEPLSPVRQKRRINALRVVVLLLVPIIFFGESHWTDRHILFELFEVGGILVIIGGVLGRFWAILYAGGNKNALVLDQGPYSTCRHPLYLFSTVAAVGFGMMQGSFLSTLAIGGAIFAILTYTATLEERFLLSKFGDVYRDYAARVPRIVPRPGLYASPPRIEVNVAALRTNFFDALVFLGLIPLAEAAEYLKEMSGWPTFPLY